MMVNRWIDNIDKLPGKDIFDKFSSSPLQLIKPGDTTKRIATGRQVKKGDIQKYGKLAIIETLNDCDWNISMATQALGISRNTLYQCLLI